MFEWMMLGVAAMAAGLIALPYLFPEEPSVAFRNKRLREGATYAQIEVEVSLRFHMAMLRRQVSEAVLLRPGSHKEIVAEAITHHAFSIEGMHGKPAGDLFVAVCNGLTDREILYADALAAVRAANPLPDMETLMAGADPRWKEDYDAAFRDV